MNKLNTAAMKRIREQRESTGADDVLAEAPLSPLAPVIKRSAPTNLHSLMAPLGVSPSLPTVAVSAEQPASQDYKIGQSYVFPLSLIRESKYNARVHYRIEELESMSLSLSEQGQLVPGRGFLKDGIVHLVDGQKRFRAAPAAGLSTYRVELCQEPESNIKHYLQSREINEQRSEQTVLDDAVRFSEFLADGVAATQEILGELMNMSQTKMTRILSINKIPEQLLRRMREVPSLTTFISATTMAQLFTERTYADARTYIERKGDSRTAEEVLSDLANDIVDKATREEMSSNQIQNEVKKASSIFERLAKTRPHASKNQFVFGNVVGILRTFEEAGRLDLSIRGLTREKLKELHEHLAKIGADTGEGEGA